MRVRTKQSILRDEVGWRRIRKLRQVEVVKRFGRHGSIRFLLNEHLKQHFRVERNCTNCDNPTERQTPCSCSFRKALADSHVAAIVLALLLFWPTQAVLQNRPATGPTSFVPVYVCRDDDRNSRCSLYVAGIEYDRPADARSICFSSLSSGFEFRSRRDLVPLGLRDIPSLRPENLLQPIGKENKCLSG